MDKAGWHVANDLEVPANIIFVPLPPYSPELNAIERLWQVMRYTLLSQRLFTDLYHIIEVCCTTWNTLIKQPGRIQSRCGYVWAAPVKTS
jgi:transposase